MNPSSQDKFTLTGGDAEFGSRAKNIFADLESLEAQHIAVESSEAVRRESYALMKPDPSDDILLSSSGPGDSAKFHVPSRPPPKRIHSSSRPGYEASPSKWKCYDLSDVPASQLTEQSNQAAAKAFLSRSTKVQMRDDDATETIDRDVRPVFRKPDKKSDGDVAKRPLSGHHHTVEDSEDVDDTGYAVRTQILSFADDELNETGKIVDIEERFRRRSGKRSADRQVRSQIRCTDDVDDEHEHEGVCHTVEDMHDTSDMPSVSKSNQTASDSESDSDDFSEVAQLGSDSDQEEDSSSCDTGSQLHHDSSASAVERYAPEDVDLDGVD